MKMALTQVFKKLVNNNTREELWADKVEASLGTLLVAEKIKHLDDALGVFLPENITRYQIYYSLSQSIRSFPGSTARGNPAKRKRCSAPPIIGRVWL